MNYSDKNKQDIRSLYVHDFVFKGLLYDYEKRQILFECKNYTLKKKYEFSFNNVIFFDMQSCDFWHGGTRFYSMQLVDSSEIIKKEILKQEQSGKSIANTYLDSGVSYITIELILVSGDVLRITCESIDCREK